MTATTLQPSRPDAPNIPNAPTAHEENALVIGAAVTVFLFAILLSGILILLVRRLFELGAEAVNRGVQNLKDKWNATRPTPSFPSPETPTTQELPKDPQ